MTLDEAKTMLERLADHRHRNHWISTQMSEVMRSPLYAEWMADLFDGEPTPKLFVCFLRAATTPHAFLHARNLEEALGTFCVAHRVCNEDCNASPEPAVENGQRRWSSWP